MKPLKFLGLIAATALAVLVVLSLLPHDRYIRFQTMASSSVHFARAKWLYERIHFDQTPIDVAFIGSSHTQCSIDAELVEKRLHELGHDWHVVNFAIPRLGRDMHYLVARELLENRKISTLVIELQEGESRQPHPGYELLADTSDMLIAPLVVNTGYLTNIVHLPLRQASLFLRTTFPSLFGVHRDFEPGDYEGQYFNDTYELHGFTEPRTHVYPAGHFKKETDAMWQVFNDKQALGKKFTVPPFRYSLPYRYNLLYLDKILALAKEKNVRVIFYYMPFENGPAQPVEAEMVAPSGPIISPTEIMADPGVWENEEHFNVYGARRASAWIADQLDKLAITGNTAATAGQ